MTSPGDAGPIKPPPSFSPGASLVTRFPEKAQSSQPLNNNLAESNIISSPTVPFSPVSPASPARSASPIRRVSSAASQVARSSIGSPLGVQLDSSDDVRSLIIRAFSPTVGVYASEDTNELARQKGFKGGFRELIRPFGEIIPGKVVIRDSNGSSRGWEDYGVRFVELSADQFPSARNESPLAQIEEVLERHLDSADDPVGGLLRPGALATGNIPPTSPFYKLFLRRLLSTSSSTPHETFGHPVACVIAISSRNTAPLESLRQLYADTSQGYKKLPPWVHPEFLRYYVLVHDEDRDDITESTRLYDQMKRHFGLHCHLLRLRSNQCVVTDDDSVQVPPCEWLSPSEDLSKMGETATLIDLGTEAQYLFDSDVAAIKTFVRELVAQSVIPYMENRVALWNDQVASRRRGISGRFMSMSRQWARFGAGTRSSIAGSGLGGTSGNYDTTHGFYKPDAPEALLRKLADFAFMLRDWKLASSTYELLKTDFSNDKAWKYHAGAHEMCAVSMLLNPLSASAKIKLESVDQMFETACYSYLTRCSDAPNALRSLSLGIELLKSRGGSATESAAKWAMRVMDLGLVGPIGQILFHERISACYASKTGTSGAKWGARRRKAAMWSVLAADAWQKHGKPTLASACLEESDRLYADVLKTEGVFPMPEMQAFIDGLKRAVKVEYLESRGIDTTDEAATADQLGTEETSEKLDQRQRGRSLIGASNPLEAGPQIPVRLKRDEGKSPDDDFE
ncbi:hypothetical protein VTN00DRAFT_4008 [Thermoascus crustaceus]|uniref:uncharacterized protein n=1 Tax=Thermoascus crustaceus TaxID=5088 RepID=UPI003743595E